MALRYFSLWGISRDFCYRRSLALVCELIIQYTCLVGTECKPSRFPLITRSSKFIYCVNSENNVYQLKAKSRYFYSLLYTLLYRRKTHLSFMIYPFAVVSSGILPKRATWGRTIINTRKPFFLETNEIQHYLAEIKIGRNSQQNN